MDKKTIILTVTLSIIVLVGLLYFIGKQSLDNTPHINGIVGQVAEVKNGAIVVSGTIGSETKVIEFMFTPQTVFTKSVIVISTEQAKSGKSFAPETQTLPGTSSELAKDMTVRITTMDNLLETSSAQALEIDYTTYDLPF